MKPFLDFFKGLHIKTNNNSQLPNEGAALYLDINDPSSKATIYFKQNGEATSYDLLIILIVLISTHVELDASNTSLMRSLQTQHWGKMNFMHKPLGRGQECRYQGC